MYDTILFQELFNFSIKWMELHLIRMMRICLRLVHILFSSNHYISTDIHKLDHCGCILFFVTQFTQALHKVFLWRKGKNGL
jgi:hypothetical protein